MTSHTDRNRTHLITDSEIRGVLARDSEQATRKPIDLVNSPPHYTAHPSGVECIEITESMGFCLGNALKYIWRADLKGDSIEDLNKAIWYLNREIARRRIQAAFDE